MRSRLNRIVNWEQIAEEALYSTHSLAKIVGVSVRQLERYFEEENRGQPHEWLNLLRQTKAMQLLASGRTVKEVANQMGYKQASHFSREFKRYYGIAPADVRASNNPEVANRYGKSQIDMPSIFQVRSSRD